MSTPVPNLTQNATAGLPDDSGEFPPLTPREVDAPQASIAGAMQDGEDPGDYTMDEVKAHLDRASSDEVARVLDVEKAGENRKGLLGDDWSEGYGIPDVDPVSLSEEDDFDATWDDDAKVAWVDAAQDSAEARRRASAVWEGSEQSEELADGLRSAVYGDGYGDEDWSVDRTNFTAEKIHPGTGEPSEGIEVPADGVMRDLDVTSDDGTATTADNPPGGDEDTAGTPGGDSADGEAGDDSSGPENGTQA